MEKWWLVRLDSHLINDRLHVRLVSDVAVQQGGPLFGGDPQPRLGRHLYDLSVVFSSQRLVAAELLLELHQRRLSVSLGHL